MSTSAPMLKVDGLVKRFGGVVALDGISFEIEEGSVHAILGPNGCGKTTLFNLIDGSLKTTAGRVEFDGHRIDGLSSSKIVRMGIARKFQVPGVFNDLTVAQNLEVALAGEDGRFGFLGLLLARPERVRRDRLAEVAGLTEKLEYAVAELSHGEKQRLEIAMLLTRNVRLLLLDEPTAGMSVTETEAIAELVCVLRDEHGLTVLVVEHDLLFVKTLGAPILVANDGKIIASGDYDAISQDPRVVQSYLGAAANA
ncbi:ABC transporter ATP-binding protein [Roseovarius sp. TE539]|uniref:ABC transporter ATP-binding protein n=1 Tax=Roseovarius sp. TE539 TaxID=2249812 RepID=UPI001C679104|nr:ABC transporter ATP-binding protein [Roseovarius sp. TE539]